MESFFGMGKKSQKKASNTPLKEVLQGVEHYLLEVAFIAEKDLKRPHNRDDTLVLTMRKEFAENMLQWFRFSYRKLRPPVVED